MSCFILHKICSICKKEIKQNGSDNLDNCQGHNIFSVKDEMMKRHKNFSNDDNSQLARRIFDKDIRMTKF